MTEGTKGLRPVRLWEAWGAALARSSEDLEAVLAGQSPQITAQRPATRLRFGLRRTGEGGQLVFELRVDFGGAPRAEVNLDGTVHRQNGIIGEGSSERASVTFGGKYVEFLLVHESVPRLMDAVYSRSTFMPQLPELLDVARIVTLETAVDVTLGAAQRIYFERRGHKDEEPSFERMGFALTDKRGALVTPEDVASWEARYGPNGAWPSGVAWRRDDGAVIDGTEVTFGANARRLFR
ncbi:hypothetical protein [Nannocystis sp. SCPEA4]|uniref:hypothetical protein n=1 Tax=Nannocystis sp. SCPEA4 TaxID=2996787 RepID=UPI00226DA99C|nr:hypothetical protein [Nannocystis sp. SCPEA4]MCY1057494.1 hypothetical protein [Nannocystis sp. SCPEA4]